MAYPPAALPTNATDGASPTDTTPTAVLTAAEVNAMNAAVNDVVSELGANPSGAAADVGARLAAIESAAAALPGTYAPLSTGTPIDVTAHGAVGDATTDSTAAIQAAITAAKAPGGPGHIYFPPGVYLYASQLNFDNTTDCGLRGNAGYGELFMNTKGQAPRTELRYTGTGSGNAISAVEASGLSIENIALTYSSAGFTGNLVYAQGAPSFNLRIKNAKLAGANAAAVNATLLKIPQGVEHVFDDVVFDRAAVGVDGQGGGYCNAIFFNNCHFGWLTTIAKMAGWHWSWSGCTFEPAGSSQTGAAGKFTGTAYGVTFTGCGWWDANGGAWFDVKGGGLTILGGYWEPQGGSSEVLVRVNTDSGTPSFDGLTIRGLRGTSANNSASSPVLVAWSKSQATETFKNIDVAGNTFSGLGAALPPTDGLDAISGQVSFVGQHGHSALKIHGNGGSATTLTRAAAQRITLSAAACAFTLPGVGADVRAEIDLYLTQDGSGGRLVTWPAGVVWPGGVAPTLTTTAGRTDIIRIETVTGGSVWIGRVLAQNISAANTPGSPTGLAAVAGNGQASLSWTAPASDGGASVTDYVAQVRTTAGPGAWTTFAEGTSASTSATVTGLTNGTSYDFQVAAVNAVGQGSYSASATATPSAGSGFNPLSGIPWTAAYWASDPAWSAPSSGAGVSSWRDGSGNSRTLSQGTGTKQPVFLSADSTLNNMPCVSFDGADDHLLSTSFTQAQPLTVVAVLSGFTGDINGKRLLSSVNGPDAMQIMALAGNYQVFASTALTQSNVVAPSATKKLLTFSFSGASSGGSENGTPFTLTGNPGAAGITSGVSVGARVAGDLPAQVKVAFLAIYAGDITAHADWAAFKAWVASTYGITTA